MERQTGESELLLTCRRTAEGVAVLRCAADTAHAVLPDRVLGQPVTALGPYALSQREPDLSGYADAFQVHVTCGGMSPQHDASAIRDLVLPAGLKTVGDYAFYNCRNLAHLTLTGSVERLGSDSFMNCPVRSIALDLGADGKSCLRLLLADCLADLEVALRLPDGTEARLFFPAYREELELLAAPHIFQTRILGAATPAGSASRTAWWTSAPTTAVLTGSWPSTTFPPPAGWPWTGSAGPSASPPGRRRPTGRSSPATEPRPPSSCWTAGTRRGSPSFWPKSSSPPPSAPPPAMPPGSGGTPRPWPSCWRTCAPLRGRAWTSPSICEVDHGRTQ